MTDGLWTVGRGHRRLLLAAAGATALLVLMGGTVCITGSTLGCPDWPGCYGRAVPPLRSDSVIEYTHRMLALVAAPLLLAVAGYGWWRARGLPWVSRPPVAAVGLFMTVAVFGAFAVLTGLPPGLAALDLGSALLALALMVVSAAVARTADRRQVFPGRLALRTPVARWGLAATSLTFAVFVLGVLVARPGSIARCLGWPLYDAETLAATGGGALQALRVWLSVGTGLALLSLPLAARRGGEGSVSGPLPAAVPAGFLLAELLLGRLLAVIGARPWALVLYVALAVAMWVSVVALTTAAALPGRWGSPERRGGAGPGAASASSGRRP